MTDRAYGASGSSPPDSYISDERLSGLAVGILARMLADPTYPRSIKGIAGRSHEGQVAVGKARALLKQYGYLTDKKTPGFKGVPPHRTTLVSPQPRNQGSGTAGGAVTPESGSRSRFLNFADVRHDLESEVVAATREDEASSQVNTGTLDSGSHVHRDVVEEQSATELSSTNGLRPISEHIQEQESSSTRPYAHATPESGSRSVDVAEYEATPRPEGWDGEHWPNDGHGKHDSRLLQPYYRWNAARRVSA